ncbi:MAG: hypothetical protein ACOYT4_03415 [Nanoarchaeota archaeon]
MAEKNLKYVLETYQVNNSEIKERDIAQVRKDCGDEVNYSYWPLNHMAFYLVRRNALNKLITELSGFKSEENVAQLICLATNLRDNVYGRGYDVLVSTAKEFPNSSNEVEEWKRKDESYLNRTYEPFMLIFDKIRINSS